MIFASRISRNLPFLVRIGILLAFTGAALIYGMVFDDWSLVDSLYWMMATVTTVGYGDYSPYDKGTNGIVFGIIFIVVGIVFIFDIISNMIEDYCDAVAKAATSEKKEVRGTAASFLIGQMLTILFV